MKNKKFSKKNDKEVNTKIEIRKEILVLLRDFSKDLDRELYNSNERLKIHDEVKEIASLIKDKDMFMRRVECLEPLTKEEMYVKDDLIRETRKKVRALLRLKIDSIVAGQYDSEEFKIVFNEVEEAKQLIYEKDRLIIPKKPDYSDSDSAKKRNSHVKKYFNMDNNLDR